MKSAHIRSFSGKFFWSYFPFPQCITVADSYILSSPSFLALVSLRLCKGSYSFPQPPMKPGVCIVTHFWPLKYNMELLGSILGRLSSLVKKKKSRKWGDLTFLPYPSCMFSVRKIRGPLCVCPCVPTGRKFTVPHRMVRLHVSII